MKKKIVVYSLLSALGLAALGIGAVYATANTNGTGNPMSNLVNAIAQKFNLNVSDVQQVFDEQKAQMNTQREQQRAQMEAKNQQAFTDRINKAVTDGKLTQDQANKILAKKAELEAQKINSQNGNKDENRAVMKEQMDSLKQWATDNNIPPEYFPFGGFGMGSGRMGGMRGFGGQSLKK